MWQTNYRVAFENKRTRLGCDRGLIAPVSWPARFPSETEALTA